MNKTTSVFDNPASRSILAGKTPVKMVKKKPEFKAIIITPKDVYK